MIDVERSSPAPASLTRGSGWADEDVITALHRDFLGKCYLCEGPLRPANVVVDHRYPRHLDPDGARHHDWANLFPTCDHCNSRRSRSYPEAGLLSPGDQVERRLEQVADVVAGAPSLACRFSARDPEDRQAEATATELEHLHDPETGQTFRARSRTQELLAAIHLRYARDIYPLERNVRALRRKRAQDQPYAPADLRRAEAALQTALSRRAPFTMLIRSLVGPALADLFD